MKLSVLAFSLFIMTSLSLAQEEATEVVTATPVAPEPITSAPPAPTTAFNLSGSYDCYTFNYHGELNRTPPVRLQVSQTEKELKTLSHATGDSMTINIGKNNKTQYLAPRHHEVSGVKTESQFFGHSLDIDLIYQQDSHSPEMHVGKMRIEKTKDGFNHFVSESIPKQTPMKPLYQCTLVSPKN